MRCVSIWLTWCPFLSCYYLFTHDFIVAAASAYASDVTAADWTRAMRSGKYTAVILD